VSTNVASGGRIKVLFFESGRQGGSVLRLLSIIKRMNPSRFDIGVVSYYADRAAAGLFELPGLFCRHRLRVRSYPQPDVFKPFLGLRIPTPFSVYLFAASLLALWRYRPDVAYMNSGIGEFGPAILAARLLGTKVLCHLRMSRDLNAYETRMASHVHQFVTSSEWAARSYQRHVRGRVATTCIYEAIDLAEFDVRAAVESASPLAAGPVYVCQIGSLIARKRPRLAIEAFAIARQRVPDLKLVLVGDGPLRPELEGLVRERELQTDVLLLGHRRDVPALLRHCHIGLLLSVDEGLPNSLLEYMAASLPVVVVRLPFIDELIRNQENGVVIDDATPETTAAAILALARSVDDRERLGRAGRETIEAGAFHPDREAHGVETLLMKVVSGRRDRGAIRES
jgi:glycosyltransferase involved in cell wall biosynthesis